MSRVSLWRGVSALGLAAPIVFDFDGDDSGLVALADSTTRFDMNGDGIADQTSWIARGDALLALDRNRNGTIDDVGEISFVREKEGATTDLAGLAGLDDNADGLLDGADERFVELRLWFDRDSDGKTDAGELLSLAQAGIISIDLQGVPGDETGTPGSSIVYNRGTATLSDAKTVNFLDAGLAYRPLAEVNFKTHDPWGRNIGDFRIASTDGELRIKPRTPRFGIDGPAGELGPAALLAFRNRSVGMLGAILVDLDGDGLEARRNVRTDARFDMDGDGVGDDTGWMSGGDGLLVIDRDGDGRISAPAEISFLAEKTDATGVWDGLAALDKNFDGVLDAKDARFGDLRVWVDRDEDGVTDDGELKTLAELGIAEIGLRNGAADASARVAWNMPLSTARFTRDSGGIGTIAAVAFAFTPSRSVSEATPRIANDVYVGNSQVEQAAAQLIQAMSSFGARSQADDLRFAEENAQARLDWFGAKAS